MCVRNPLTLTGRVILIEILIVKRYRKTIGRITICVPPDFTGGIPCVANNAPPHRGSGDISIPGYGNPCGRRYLPPQVYSLNGVEVTH